MISDVRFDIGDKVTIPWSSTHSGTVVGHAVVEGTLLHVLKLDQGEYGASMELFYRYILVHPDSLIEGRLS